MPNASLDKCNTKWSIVRFCGASSLKGLDGAEGVLLSEGGDVGEVFAKSLIYRIIQVAHKCSTRFINMETKLSLNLISLNLTLVTVHFTSSHFT